MTEYRHYQNFNQLYMGIAAYVNDCLTNTHGHIGDITIKVEDVPSVEEWKKCNSTKSRKEAWDNAVGSYGIKAVGREFDSYTTMLVGAYYGSSNMVSSPMFDFDSTEGQVVDIVFDLLDNLLCDDRKGPFLVLRVESDSVPDTMKL